MSILNEVVKREYVPVAESAKALRQALKANFPGVKFSVRSSSYAGGASIRVSWFRGPSTASVNRIAKRFEGASFDGMIDLKSSKESLLCDAQGNLRNVRWGSDYVFTDREYDENQYAPSEVAKAVEAAIIARYAEGFAPEPHMLHTHEPMEHADWRNGETVEAFATRCAESYFSRDFLK